MSHSKPEMPEVCGRDGVVVARPQLGGGIDFHGCPQTRPGEWLGEIVRGFDGEIDIRGGGIARKREAEELVRTDGFEIGNERIGIGCKWIEAEGVFQEVHTTIEIRVGGISCDGGVAGVGTKAGLPPLFDGGELHREHDVIESFHLAVIRDEAQNVIANCGKAGARVRKGGISQRDRAGTAEFAPEAGGDCGFAVIADRSGERSRSRKADAGIRSGVDACGDIDGRG